MTLRGKGKGIGLEEGQRTPEDLGNGLVQGTQHKLVNDWGVDWLV